MQRLELLEYLDKYLQIREIDDYGPQGLQVETDNEVVERVAVAVDVSPSVIKAAADWQADMLIVHHGILWGSVEPIIGALGKRIRLLINHQINLYAAHLALDAHPEVGNNAILAQMFGVEVDSWWCEPKGTPIGVFGHLTRKTSLESLVRQVEQLLTTQPRVLAHGPADVNRMAIISGFGADEVAGASELGADTFITGETSHSHYWAAEDYGLNVIFAGHYATETVGVRALGRHLTDHFGLESRFLDFPTSM